MRRIDHGFAKAPGIFQGWRETALGKPPAAQPATLPATGLPYSTSLGANVQPTIFTTIAQLPSLQGFTGMQANTFSTSSGQPGISPFSLRGVGRVSVNVTGVPDISLFSQLLIQRMDVANGGASASYGSDAARGMINFITVSHSKGLKGNVQVGITTYGVGLAKPSMARRFAALRAMVLPCLWMPVYGPGYGLPGG